MSHNARERCVIVCPQCEGEGGYPDGVDEDACHMDCTRCGGNGWIVDLATLSPDPVLLEEVREVLTDLLNFGREVGWRDGPTIRRTRALLDKLPKLTGEEV